MQTDSAVARPIQLPSRRQNRGKAPKRFVAKGGQVNLSPLSVADVMFPLARMFTAARPGSIEVKAAAGGLRALWRAADPIDRSQLCIVCARKNRGRGKASQLADAILRRERTRAAQGRGTP